MKKSYLIATAVVATLVAGPVAAHHNSPWGEDGIIIGDMQGMHDAAIARMSELYSGNTDNVPEMDPSDSRMPTDIVPQPNGVGIPAESPGPVSGAGID